MSGSGERLTQSEVDKLTGMDILSIPDKSKSLAELGTNDNIFI
jgi:hypothetical protein